MSLIVLENLKDIIANNTQNVEEENSNLQKETGTQSLLDKMKAVQIEDDEEDNEDDEEDENTTQMLERMRKKIEQIHEDEDDDDEDN